MTGMEQGQNAPCGRTNRHLFFGLALIVFGALMLVDRLSAVEFDNGWPLFLIVFGIWKLIDPPASGRVLRSRRPGCGCCSSAAGDSPTVSMRSGCITTRRGRCWSWERG